MEPGGTVNYMYQISGKVLCVLMCRLSEEPLEMKINVAYGPVSTTQLPQGAPPSFEGTYYDVIN